MIADNEQVIRMVDWARNHDVSEKHLALATLLLGCPGGIDNLKGPVFDGFIEEEMERRQRQARFAHFRADDWDFYQRTLQAIADYDCHDILIVVPTMPFGEYIRELLETNDELPLVKSMRYKWVFQFPDRRCVVEMVSAASPAGRGRSVDAVVFHDAVGWRAYEALRPCQRPRRH